MTDPNIPGDPTPDATPTQALPTSGAQPVAAEPLPFAAPPPVEHKNHTRTILEVVGGVVAAGLIIVAGAVGFFVGHATGSDHDGDRFARSQDGGQFGPQAGGPGLGQGMPMMPGQGLGPQGQRGTDPDGDNWTGQNRGFDDDQQGMPMMPGQGLGPQGPQGIDPDGDNWTGQNQQQSPLDQQLQPTPQG